MDLIKLKFIQETNLDKTLPSEIIEVDKDGVVRYDIAPLKKDDTLREFYSIEKATTKQLFQQLETIVESIDDDQKKATNTPYLIISTYENDALTFEHTYYYAGQKPDWIHNLALVMLEAISFKGMPYMFEFAIVSE